MSSMKKRTFPRPVRPTSMARPIITRDDIGIDVPDGHKSPPRTGLMARSISTPDLSGKKTRPFTNENRGSPKSKFSLDFGGDDQHKDSKFESAAELLKEHGCLQSAPWINSELNSFEKGSVLESALKTRQPLRDLSRETEKKDNIGAHAPFIKSTSFDIPASAGLPDIFKTPFFSRSSDPLKGSKSLSSGETQKSSVQTPQLQKPENQVIPGRRSTPQSAGKTSPVLVNGQVEEKKPLVIPSDFKLGFGKPKTPSRFESEMAELMKKHSTPTREPGLDSKQTPSRYAAGILSSNKISPDQQVIPLARSVASNISLEGFSLSLSRDSNSSASEPSLEKNLGKHTPTRLTPIAEQPVPVQKKPERSPEDIYGSVKKPDNPSYNVPELPDPKSNTVKSRARALAPEYDVNARSTDKPLYSSDPRPLSKSTVPDVDSAKACTAKVEYRSPVEEKEKVRGVLLEKPKAFDTPAPQMEKRKADPVFLMPAAPPPAKQRHQELLFVNRKPFLVMSVLGRGGTSKVFQVFDQTSEQVLALKVVDLDAVDEATAQIFLNEVRLLERLQKTASERVIKLIDYEDDDVNKKLYILMEKGESDLAGFLKKKMKEGPLEPFTIKYYWQQMLQAVHMIHKQNIVHSDLKPANFLLVSGNLKLIDFGIATAIQPDMTSIVKDTNAGTYNYMSPEAIQVGGHYIDQNGLQKTGYKIGVKSDVWSLGCILYNLVYGRTPFQHISQAMPKLQAIINPNHQIAFPECGDPLLLDTLKLCLRRDPKSRPSIEELLKHPYLTGGEPVRLARNVEQIEKEYIGRVLTKDLIREICEKLTL